MEWSSGNVYIRPLGGEAGLTTDETIDGHAHNFDHTTIFFNGRWRVQVGDEKIVVEGPAYLLIKAGAEHKITFLGAPYEARGKAWCVYSHRTPQGIISQTWTGWERAYV